MYSSNHRLKACAAELEMVLENQMAELENEIAKHEGTRQLNDTLRTEYVFFS